MGRGLTRPLKPGSPGGNAHTRSSRQLKAKATGQQFSRCESCIQGGHLEALSLLSPRPKAGERGHTDGTAFSSVVTPLSLSATQNLLSRLRFSNCRASKPHSWAPGVEEV